MCCEIFMQGCIAGVTLHNCCHMSRSIFHSLCAALALAARSLHVVIWCTIKVQPWTDCSKGMPTPWTYTECVHQHHLSKTSQHCPLSQSTLFRLLPACQPQPTELQHRAPYSGEVVSCVSAAPLCARCAWALQHSTGVRRLQRSAAQLFVGGAASGRVPGSGFPPRHSRRESPLHTDRGSLLEICSEAYCAAP